MERKPSKFASATSNQVSAREASGEKPEVGDGDDGHMAGCRGLGERHGFRGIGGEADGQHRIALGGKAQFLLGQPADGINQDIPYTEFSEGIGHVGRDREGAPEAEEIDGFGLAENFHGLVEFFRLQPFLQVLIDFSAASVKPWKMTWDFEADRACWRSCSMRSS